MMVAFLLAATVCAITAGALTAWALSLWVGVLVYIVSGALVLLVLGSIRARCTREQTEDRGRSAI